jgi:hypothetical protein
MAHTKLYNIIATVRLISQARLNGLTDSSQNAVFPSPHYIGAISGAGAKSLAPGERRLVFYFVRIASHPILTSTLNYSSVGFSNVPRSTKSYVQFYLQEVNSSFHFISHYQLPLTDGPLW